MSQPLHSALTVERPHTPVLLAEVLAALKPADGDEIADLTFGAGGYSTAILAAADCKVYGFDRDPSAIQGGQNLVLSSQGRLSLFGVPFAQFASELSQNSITGLDGVVMDIGVSSMQIDQPERGFSFMRDGLLDMRMGADGATAAEIVAEYSAERLADIIYVFGEEPKSRAIGRAIAKARSEAPIVTTRQLVSAIERATGPHRPHMRTHPATRTFQALRIYVNDELGQLVDALVAAEQMLRPGGRLVVVTFHSLEDRIVKQFLAERSGHLPSASRYAPGPVSSRDPSFTLAFKGHMAAERAETDANPRARSAKLRAAVRTEAAAWGQQGDFVKSVAGLRAS